MQNNVCKSCGGSVTRQGNYYICDFCRSKWMIDSGNDVHAVERANAWEALRNNDFEKATELFENIITKDPKDHEGYWGRALALNGIVYVNDYNENKKVPTCNNITEESFLANKDVQKALSLAPGDIKESYQKQAEQIEKIRIEWLNKASKEPAYDVFISFKDSDREHGIERTQDSIDVQDLYTALVQKGYNVFFSRVTLRDKVSEQYEPYIYNALKTAKVMIVFGEKAEYFNAVWVKNEWSRFKTRVTKGEKHKNSLITVYKNVNPYDIPAALTGGRQAIDYSIPSNFEVLMNHVKRVIDESNQAVKLDRIEIKGGQMSKKSSTIKTETLQTRELGKGVVAQTSITEQQTLDLVRSYLESAEWEDVNRLIDDLLFDNPNLADAIWYKIQARVKVVDDNKIFDHIDKFEQQDYDLIVRFLNCTEKDRATYVLNSMYDACKNVSESVNLAILKTVLPFDYEERAEKITKAFGNAISAGQFEAFTLLLSTLDTNEVDAYIKYNVKFAKNAKDSKAKQECVNNVLSVDEGNTDALKMLFDIYLEEDDNVNAIKTLENILKYSQNTKKVVLELITQIKKSLNSNQDCLVLRDLLKYYPGELVEIKDLLLDVAFVMINQGCFDHAQYILSLVLSVDENNPQVYWGICLVKTKSKTERELAISNVSLKDIPEYTKYLTMVDDARRKECFKLANNKKRDNNVVKNCYLSGGMWHSLALKSDGTVVSAGGNLDGQCNVSKWNDIVAVSAGKHHSIGLRSNGTIVTAGSNDKGQRNTVDWYNIVAISTGARFSLGLKSDGTVVSAGANEYGQGYVSGWKDMVAISAGAEHSLGLKSDGTVLSLGNDGTTDYPTLKWSDIVAISAGYYFSLGLKSDGKVVAAGNNDAGQCNVSRWADIIAISAGQEHSLGLKSNGTVVAVGKNEHGQCNVSDWKDIVAISAGGLFSLGLKSDGTVIFVGNKKNGEHGIEGVKLFDNIKTLKTEKEEQANRRQKGLCQHCGGTFKGLFSKTCTSCGKKKNY